MSKTSENHSTWLASAKAAISTETQGMQALEQALSGPLGTAIIEAMTLIRAASGRVIITGMGKSGHVARKIAATLASTGTPALFVHPAEASHGDLGMITPQDVVIMLSNSGESAELRDILVYAKRFAVPLIAMTIRRDSTLGREANVVLELPAAKEACPNGLAPTTSTLLQLALGDALAIALLEDKGFSAHDFRNFHPGGKLGAQLKHAGDIMHRGDRLPLVTSGTAMADALLTMTRKSFGCVGVTGQNGTLIGIVTDGDLRRHMGPSLMEQSADAVMTKAPKTITADMLTGEVLDMLNAARITSVFVCDAAMKPVGLIHIHDLLRIGVS
ncbi:MAG: KpsF/GutQ family sugar-phosphate isomerase [Phyllobacteriaceae bacterium]|jgi:arabinose-5-phosphate isomerase|nr:KpsF/GutQ family sugar-phosphate isomerase [Phyllobacteriaceae bacterium]